MNELIRKTIRFYGNRGVLFDAIVSLFFIVIAFPIISSKLIVVSINKDYYYSMIEFLGVFAGFLLTAFSLLYLYNPNEKNAVSSFRKHPLFLKMLKSFIFTIMLTIITIVIIYIVISLSVSFALLNYSILFFLILTLLRIIKCIYYLFVIIGIGNTNTNSGSKPD